MTAILGATDNDGTQKLLECLSLVEANFIEKNESRLNASSIKTLPSRLKVSSIKTHMFASKRFADFLVLNKTTATFSEADNRKLQKEISLWNLSLSKDVKKEVCNKGVH